MRFEDLSFGEVVGKGSSGRVYSGEFCGMPVAIKEFFAFAEAKTLSERAVLRESMLNELHIMAHVPVHTNLVSLVR